MKLGDSRSFADFEAEQFRADVLGATSEDRPHFWHAQDYAAALGPVGERRAGRPGAPGGVSPRRRRAGPAVASFRVGGRDRRRPRRRGVGATDPGERLARPHRDRGAPGGQRGPGRTAPANRATRRSSSGCWPSGCSPGTAVSDRARPPTSSTSSTAATRDWNAAVEAGGYAVHGDPTELVPLPTPPGAPHPDEVAAEVRLEATTAALADLLLQFPVTPPTEAPEPPADPRRATQGHLDPRPPSSLTRTRPPPRCPPERLVCPVTPG